MWSIFAGDRRRLAVLLAAALLLAAAVVTALLLSREPPAAAPPKTPAASASTPATATTAPSTTPRSSPSATRSTTPAKPSTPLPPSSAAPVPPPATTAPVVPVPPPAPPPVPPPAPFPASLKGADVEVIPGAGPVVALTFDAGANSAGLPSILRTLGNTGVRATFFLTGNWASANPAGVASIVAAGHRVGNHSMTHPGFTTLSDAQIAQQLSGAQAAIAAGGADSRPLFRFPFGNATHGPSRP